MRSVYIFWFGGSSFLSPRIHKRMLCGTSPQSTLKIRCNLTGWGCVTAWRCLGRLREEMDWVGLEPGGPA